MLDGASESESDYEDVVEDRLSLADIDALRGSLSEKCSSVSAYLLSSREPVEKRRLIESTMQDLLSAFNTMAANYLKARTVLNTTAVLKGVISSTIKREVTSAVHSALTSPSTSYASMVSKPVLKQQSTKVRVTNGPTVTVPHTVSVVVGPKKDSVAAFSSPDDTCKAMVKAVKPGDIGLKVNRIVHTRNNSVRIIADSLDVSKLKMCPALAAAGLEIKERERLNPRLIVRDVPTDLTNDDLAAQLVSFNLDAPCNDQVKVIYRYASRRPNGLASVVIETNAAIRNRLLRTGRVNLEWRSCKIEDYLRVLQCFKCQDFGHLAKNCPSEAVCGNCAESHETLSCSSSSSVKCVNCFRSKLSDCDHKAFDAAKCPMIKKRLTEKAKNIAY